MNLSWGLALKPIPKCFCYHYQKKNVADFYFKAVGLDYIFIIGTLSSTANSNNYKFTKYTKENIQFVRTENFQMYPIFSYFSLFSILKRVFSVMRIFSVMTYLLTCIMYGRTPDKIVILLLSSSFLHLLCKLMLIYQK